ncbi:MAG: glycosyltransferase family 39 protein [Isosphaeraceae bacterium]
MSRTIARSDAGQPSRRSLAAPGSLDANPCAQWACAAILVFSLSQIVFLLVGCDWDFSGDEAEFWEWSRRLEWSYFARGPLIAWLMRLSTEMLGAFSRWLTGSLMFALRFPAIVLGALTAWGIFRLGSLTTGSQRSALLAVLLLPAIPVLAIGGVLMTCDTPLLCCWTWAAVWTFRALQTSEPRAWIAAGVIGALGVLAKYTMLAFPASIGLFLLFYPPHRHQLRKPGYWVMSSLCVVLGLAPILAWNAQHEWVAFGQLADRVGLSSRAQWGGIKTVLIFVAGDFAALGGIWWIAGVAALVQALILVTRKSETSQPASGPPHPDPLPDGEREKSGTQCGFLDSPRPVGERKADVQVRGLSLHAGLMFLLCLWGVIWTACFGASLLGETEANWMVPGYLSLVILIGMRVERVFHGGGRRALSYIAAWCVSVAAVIALHHTEWFFPMFARWVPASTKGLPAPLRRIDPTCRMRGHKKLAEEVAKRMAAVQAEGGSPFVVTPTYALTSTLSFYLPGQPETYCLSWNYGMTAQPVNQHDLWHPNPRHEQAAFRGRAAIIVDDSNMPPNFANQMIEKGVFDHLVSIERIFVREQGVVVGTWDIAICREYKGLTGYKQNPIVPSRRASVSSRVAHQ